MMEIINKHLSLKLHSCPTVLRPMAMSILISMRKFMKWQKTVC